VRLEALEDPSLPDNGPGLAGNGNFLLQEFVVVHRPVVGLTLGPSESVLLPVPPPR